MSYKALHLKEGKKWELGVRYNSGSVSFRLTSKSDRREYPQDNLALTPKEWDRLVTWVEYTRAEDALSS